VCGVGEEEQRGKQRKSVDDFDFVLLSDGSRLTWVCGLICCRLLVYSSSSLTMKDSRLPTIFMGPVLSSTGTAYATVRVMMSAFMLPKTKAAAHCSAVDWRIGCMPYLVIILVVSFLQEIFVQLRG
jgi:hypothetical protein